MDLRFLNQVYKYNPRLKIPTVKYPRKPVRTSFKVELNMAIGLRVYTGPDTPAWVYAEGVMDVPLY